MSHQSQRDPVDLRAEDPADLSTSVEYMIVHVGAMHCIICVPVCTRREELEWWMTENVEMARGGERLAVAWTIARDTDGHEEMDFNPEPCSCGKGERLHYLMYAAEERGH